MKWMIRDVECDSSNLLEAFGLKGLNTIEWLNSAGSYRI